MPDSAPDEPKPKRTRRKSGGANDPRPVASVDMAATSLEDQLRRDVPGAWTADRLNQSQHNDGVTYIAINALMTAIRSSTLQVNRKRKPIAFDSESGVGSRVVKSLPSTGTSTDSKKFVPFDDENHALVKLLAMPNQTETINELLAQLVQQIMLTGSGLLWMNVDRLGLPQELYVLPTALCYAQPPSPTYPYGYQRVTSYYPAGAYGILAYPGAGGGVPIDNRNIMRFKQPHPLWRWDALSPLTAGSVQLTILEAIDQARFSAMESGMTTDAFITAMGQSQEQMNAWMEQVRQNNVGKRNHRKIMALGGESSEKGDVKVTFPNVSAKDMDYSAGWDQMSGFCLSLFGVPKAVANFTDASSYAQLFAALKQFHTLTLVPLANWLSKWMTLHLCQQCYGPQYSIQIDVPAIDDADMAEKKRATNLSNGLLKYNEARAEINLPPVEGGDDLIASVFVQVQTAKAMAAAQPQPAPAAPGEPAPAPNGDPNAAPAPDAAQGTAAPGESLPADPLSSLTAEGREPDSESLPDETNAPDAGDETDSTQDAVTNAALSALGITSDKGEGDGASESDDSPIPQNRIAKAYLANGNGHHLKAVTSVTKPGTPRREGEKWQGRSGKWFTLKSGRTVPTAAPGAASESLPSSSSRNPQDAAAKQSMPAPASDRVKVPNVPGNYPGRGAKTVLSLDAQAKEFLAGKPSMKLLATGSGKAVVHEIKDGASLKAYYADGGKIPTSLVESAAKTLPASTPAAQQSLSTADQWAETQAAKHADKVAAHFGVSPAKAHAILVAAIKQVAAHAAATGKNVGISIKHGGKTAKLSPKKTATPARNPSGVPSIPKPANKSGTGSLPPKMSKGFDANEKRDESGKWSESGGGESAPKFTPAKLPPPSDDPKVKAPNPVLPDQSRPELAPDEVKSLTHYSGGGYTGINKLLRGQPSEDPDLDAADHERLQKAFAKAIPFDKPVTTYRAIQLGNMEDDERDALLAALDAAKSSGGTITIPGYTSTTTDKGWVDRLNVDAVVEVVARKGLDVKPYAKKPHEQELLLDHNSRFKVLGHTTEEASTPNGRKFTRHIIKLQQVPDSGGVPITKGMDVHADGDAPDKFIDGDISHWIFQRAKRVITKSTLSTITKAIDGVSYGCVMLPMPADVTAACLEYIARIDERDLLEAENDSHVTLLYGLTDSDPQPVADILEAHPPVPLTFGAFSLFTSPEHDVLKVDVESLPLRRLHGQLASLPHESSYPDYRPHLTIAYLQPGTGEYYAALFGSFPIPHGTATEAVYSDADYEETTIPFAGTVTKAAMSAYSDSTGGALIAPAAQTPLVPSVRGKKKKRRPLAALCKSILAELDGDESTSTPELPPELAAVLSSLTAPALPFPSE